MLFETRVGLCVLCDNLSRQQPATASDVTFVTLEDESGTLNAVVWRDLARRFWRVFRDRACSPSTA